MVNRLKTWAIKTSKRKAHKNIILKLVSDRVLKYLSLTVFRIGGLIDLLNTVHGSEKS